VASFLAGADFLTLSISSISHSARWTLVSLPRIQQRSLSSERKPLNAEKLVSAGFDGQLADFFAN
jgi:hypothetical protein